jgi:hypothetical protein
MIWCHHVACTALLAVQLPDAAAIALVAYEHTFFSSKAPDSSACLVSRVLSCPCLILWCISGCQTTDSTYGMCWLLQQHMNTAADLISISDVWLTAADSWLQENYGQLGPW